MITSHCNLRGHENYKSLRIALKYETIMFNVDRFRHRKNIISNWQQIIQFALKCYYMCLKGFINKVNESHKNPSVILSLLSLCLSLSPLYKIKSRYNKMNILRKKCCDDTSSQNTSIYYPSKCVDKLNSNVMRF